MHELRMITQSINLCDYIRINLNSNGKIRLTCNKNICPPEENIAYKAAEHFFKDFNLPQFGVDIKIIKNIPVQAGLGGGSADAAAVIFALSKIFGIVGNKYKDFISFLPDNKKDSKKILKIASKTGSDVPVCLIGGTLLYDKGKLNSIQPLPRCEILVLKPETGVSTRQAYDFFDKNRAVQKSLERIERIEKLKSAIEKKDIDDIFEKTFNDFDINSEKFKLTGSGSARFKFFAVEEKMSDYILKLSKIFGKIITRGNKWDVPENSGLFLCQPTDFGVKIVDCFRN
jgi:4-diphosphocytidyl-2-C-methyl-D-erythritol kinase